MKNSILAIVVWFIILTNFISVKSFAQIDSNFSVDMHHILKNANINGLKSIIQYKIYDANNIEALLDQTQMVYIIKGKKYYLDNKEATFYCNDEFNLVKVKKEKVLLIYKPGKDKFTVNNFNIIDSSFMNSIKFVSMLMDTGDIRQYQIGFPESSIFLTWKITIHKNGYLLENRVEYKKSMNDLFKSLVNKTEGKVTPYLVIQFKDVVKPTKEDLDLCYATDIGSISKKRIELKPIYKSYVLNNFLISN